MLPLQYFHIYACLKWTQYACLYLYYHINCSFEMVWTVLTICFFPLIMPSLSISQVWSFLLTQLSWCQCHTTQSLGIHQILKFFLTSYLVFIISLSISQVWSLFLTHLAMQIAFFNFLFIYLQVSPTSGNSLSHRAMWSAIVSISVNES